MRKYLTPKSLEKLRLISKILIALIFISCSKERELKFEENINYFDEGFVDHFPKKINYLGSLHSISQNISNDHPHVRLRYFPNKRKLDSIENSSKLIAIGIYSSNDTCLVVLDKHLNSENWFKIDKDLRFPKPIEYEDKDCHKDKYPVPNFYEEWWMETDKTLTKLEGYTMYVLEAKKGIAINRGTGAVIYWADIW